MMKDKRVLYLSYNALSSHLGRSQILPYLQKLTDRGYEFFVISFENEDNEQISDDTIGQSCFFHWYRLHRTKVPRVLSIFQWVIIGTTLAIVLMLKHKIYILHARSYLPGLAAFFIKGIIPKARVIFDMRGFMLDEYLEGGNLSVGSPWIKLGRFFEKRIFQNADCLVTLTHKSLAILNQPKWVGKRSIPITVIPCCTLLDEQKEEKRNSRIDLSQGIRLIYSGSLGSWYDFPRMLSFFKTFHQRYADSALEILSPQADSVRQLIHESSIQHRIELATVPFSNVRNHLLGAHVGLLFYRPGFSRIGTSPIKFAEYLWAGLVIVATAGIGDMDELIQKYQVGVVLNGDHDEMAIEDMVKLLTDPELKKRCHWVAKRFYDLEDGVKQYEAVYGSVI